MRFPLFTLIAPVISSVVLWLVTGSAFVLLFAAMGPLMAVANYLDTRRTARQAELGRSESAELAQAQASFAARASEQDAVAQACALNPPISAMVTAGELVRPPWCVREVDRSIMPIRLGVEAHSGYPVVENLAGGVAVVGSGVLAASAQRSIEAALQWGWGENNSLREQLSDQVEMYANFGMVPPRTRWVLQIGAEGSAHLTDVASPTSLPRQIHVDLLTRAEAEVINGKLVAHETASTVQAAAGLTLEELDLVDHGPHAVVAGMTGSGKTEFLLAWLMELCGRFTPAELNILVLDYKGGIGFGRLAAFPHVVGIVTDLTPALASRALRSLRAEIRHRERVLGEHRVTDLSALPVGVLPRLVIVADEYRALLEASPEAAGLFVDLTSRGRALGIHVILTTQHTGGVLADAILANCALRVCFRVTQSHDSRTLLGDDRATQLPHKPGVAIVLGNQLPAQQLTVTPVDDHRLYAASVAAQAWVATHSSYALRRPWLDPLPTSLDPLPTSLVINDLPNEASPGAAPSRASVDGSASTTTVYAGSLSLTFGLSDDPDNQAQPFAAWNPLVDGHLLVSGPLRSGRSSTLSTFADAALANEWNVALVSDAEKAWDLVMAPPVNGLLLLDNLESVLAAMDHDHRDAFTQALQALLREGGSRGLFVVVATLDHGAAVAQLEPLMRTRLTLAGNPASSGLANWRGLTTQVAVPAGVATDAAAVTDNDTDNDTATLTPAMSASGAAASPPTPALTHAWNPHHTYLVVTHRPRALAQNLDPDSQARVVQVQPGMRPDIALAAPKNLSVNDPASVSPAIIAPAPIYIGDSDDWQGAYQLLTSLRGEAYVLLDGCSAAEVRSLRLFRGLLPFTKPGTSILLSPEGQPQRVLVSGNA